MNTSEYDSYIKNTALQYWYIDDLYKRFESAISERPRNLTNVLVGIVDTSDGYCNYYLIFATDITPHIFNTNNVPEFIGEGDSSNKFIANQSVVYDFDISGSARHFVCDISAFHNIGPIAVSTDEATVPASGEDPWTCTRYRGIVRFVNEIVKPGYNYDTLGPTRRGDADEFLKIFPEFISYKLYNQYKKFTYRNVISKSTVLFSDIPTIQVGNTDTNIPEVPTGFVVEKSNGDIERYEYGLDHWFDSIPLADYRFNNL